ncbi:MAG: AraC family transcriptional regulator [Pseudomonadota bacterium]
MKPLETQKNSLDAFWSDLWVSNHLNFVVVAFWISIASFIVTTAWDLGAAEFILGMAGTASCGFSWLLARALFRADVEREVWPISVVAGLILTGLILSFGIEASAASGLAGVTLGVAHSVHALISSTVLLLAFIEAFLGYRSDLPRHEKQFRIAYAAGYGSLLGVSVLWLNSVPDSSQAARDSDMIKMVCATLAIGLSVWAWRFRVRHPLPRPKRQQRRMASISDADKALADRILQRLEADKLYLDPDLSLGRLARSLGEADHRVSKCITGVLGDRNFNSLVNRYRIEAAKAVLEDAGSADASILAVALDAGFSSIGPFNRAFKTQTGLTPSQYRRRNVA